MGAALAGDRQLQVDVIDGWSDFASKKTEAIEAFLVFLFTTEILRLYRQDRVLQGIRLADHEQIVTEMRARAAAAGIDECKFWQEAINFWRPEAGGLTEATLIARILKFDRWLNIDRVICGVTTPVLAV